MFESSPFIGLFREASVFHDVACQRRTRPYKHVHRMFSDAMIDNGYTGFGQKKKAFAVMYFGPKW